MTSFEMIKYHGQEYPQDIPLHIEEIAAHFDVSKIAGRLQRSLHTEYSYGKRKFESEIIQDFPNLVAAQKDGVPQLWKDELWATEFAEFIIKLEGRAVPPRIIEIHPPFNDYTDMRHFASAYKVFESAIKECYPNVEMLIENRCGSIYRGGRFLVSKITDLFSLCEEINKSSLSLQIAFDVPQIYTAHNAESEVDFAELLYQAKEVRDYIGGVHLWGKRAATTGRKVSHCGDLNSYFGNDGTKQVFLQAFKECFDDNNARKMVLEVNSGNEDLRSIIKDLQSVGVTFG